MNKDKNNKQTDGDILQNGIRKKTNRTYSTESAYPKEPASPSAEKDEKDAIKVSHGQTEIPKFDLAEEIMAEQRRITATKRKAPGKKNEAGESEADLISYTFGQPRPTLPEQDQIIAEIVARDIEKLCKCDHSKNNQ